MSWRRFGGLARRARWGWLPWSAVAAVAGFGIASVALSVVTGWDRVEVAGLAVGHLALTVVAAFVVARSAAARVGWILVVVTVAGSVTMSAEQLAYLEAVRGDDVAAGRAALGVADASFAFVAVGVMLFALVFPDARLLSPRWCILAAAMVAFGTAAVAVSLASAPEIEDPGAYLLGDEAPGGGAVAEALEWSLVILLTLSAAALLVRLHRTRGEQRQQVKWVVFAGAVVALHFPLTSVVRSDLIASLLPGTVALLLSGALAVALFRYRLWDIDAVIRGSLIYGILWAVIAASYLGVAAGLGLTAGSRLPLGAAVVATVAAAMVFQPARRALERVADRWVFGARAAPHAAVGELGEVLGRADRPDDVAAHLARTATAAARLGWVEVALGGHDPVSVGDANREPITTVPVARGDEPLGCLRCQPRPGARLSAEDETLLSALAAQAALAVSHAHLASRVVHAQAAERRRIERDLHDGAQQELVALVAQLGLAGANADGYGPVFDRLQRDAQRILANLRDLAQGIHPSVLTDGGLFEAVGDCAARLPITVTVEVPAQLRGQRLDEDVEAAAYFLVAEVLTNVVKHAAATAAQVRFGQRRSTLSVEISDDGCGFDPQATPPRGLAGLADRVQAIGGQLVVDSAPGTGTRVRASLPFVPAART